MNFIFSLGETSFFNTTAMSMSLSPMENLFSTTLPKTISFEKFSLKKFSARRFISLANLAEFSK